MHSISEKDSRVADPPEENRIGNRAAALDLIDLAAAIVTDQGTIEFANAAWRKAVAAGFPTAGSGASFLDALHVAAQRGRERAYATLADLIAAVIASERSTAKLELRLQIAGERRWFQANVKPCESGCLVTLDDQTAARASYSSMVEVTRVLRTVLDNTPHCIFWLDKFGCIEGANQLFFDDTALGGITGKMVGELEWDGPLAAYFRQTVVRVAAEGRKLRSVIEVPSTTGGMACWIDASVDPLISGDGTVLGFVCAYVDVSDIKAQEKLLHLTQSSIDQANQALLWVGAGGAVAYCNEAATALSGYGDAELRKLDFFRLQDRIALDAWRDRWAAPDAQAWTLELELFTKSGTRIPVEFVANPIEHGGDKYISVYLRDVREQTALTKSVRAAEERLSLTLECAGVGTYEWDIVARRLINQSINNPTFVLT